jgi:hypothetical protein
VLKAAGETETTQENIQDWLELDEGDPGFQLLDFLQLLNKGSTVIFLYLFSSALLISLHFPFICVFFLLLGLPSASLIRMTSLSSITPNWRGFIELRKSMKALNHDSW